LSLREHFCSGCFGLVREIIERETDVFRAQLPRTEISTLINVRIVSFWNLDPIPSGAGPVSNGTNSKAKNLLMLAVRPPCVISR